MVPPAPALFSTTIGWPMLFAIASPTVRPTMSVALPALKGTMKWIGLDG